MVVQHNLTAMNSNRMLGLTTASQAKSTERLSSGYKINRAADDAAGLSISEKMRKQIRGLTQASANAQDGISAVQTAEGALTEVHDMLQRMNELAVKAANGTQSANDRSYIQDEIDQLITEIDRVSETTKFNETYLLKGDTNAEASKNFKYKATDVLKEDYWYVDKKGEVQKAAKGTYMGDVNTSYTYYTSSAAGRVGENLTNSDVTVVSFVNTDAYYTYDASSGEYKQVASGMLWDSSMTYYTVEFNTAGGIGTATMVASSGTTGSLTLSTGYIYDDSKVTGTVYNTAGDPVGTDYVFAATTDVYKNVKNARIDDTYLVSGNVLATDSLAVQFVDKDGNEIAANGLYQYIDDNGKLKNNDLYLKDGDGIRAAEQKDVDALVDSSDPYKVGALTLTLHVGADATENNQISVKLDAMSAVGLGIDNLKVDGADDTNALNAIETIAAAIQKVSTQRSALGATQNRLEHTINNLDNVVENTTSAESQIRDTDMATEMVKYSNNNILAQAGQAMLAQANQANQGVLSLLG